MNQLNKTPETIAELVDALADKGIDLRSPVAPPCPSIPVDADAFGPSILQGPPMTAEEAERRATRKALIWAATENTHAEANVPMQGETEARGRRHAIIHAALEDAKRPTAGTKAAAAFLAALTPTSAATAPAATAAMAPAAPISVIGAPELASADGRSSTVSESQGSGYQCHECGAYNNVRAKPDVYYAVTVGTRVGVLHTWLLTQPHVMGVKGAMYSRYTEEAAARAAFNAALAAGIVKLVDVHGTVLHVYSVNDTA
ncbi:hypothetical protein BJ912DRAFT_1063619 [Pholiota molesta]|nr:hypothetical protein BJ912DRAFT_1063619 [Pholiota molesta]